MMGSSDWSMVGLGIRNGWDRTWSFIIEFTVGMSYAWNLDRWMACLCDGIYTLSIEFDAESGTNT